MICRCGNGQEKKLEPMRRAVEQGGDMKDKALSKLTACASAGAMFMSTLGGAAPAMAANSGEGGASAKGTDRTILPIQEPKRPLYTELDARNAKMPPHFDVKAPAGAPNTGFPPACRQAGLHGHDEERPDVEKVVILR
jgi:hypothetical protein